MTKDRIRETPGDHASPPAELPLFTQPVPAPAEQSATAGPPISVAHLTRVNNAVPALPFEPGGSPTRNVDWSLVSALRAQASEQLSQAVSADRGRLDRIAQEELGRTIVLDLIEATVADRVNTGMPNLTVLDQDAFARAVFDSLFRLGRLQPLVDDDRVENIIITGHDNVVLELTDGSLLDGPAVADSDEELIDFLVFLASRSEVNARGFSEAQPRLHLRLDGGSRLAAAAWVTPRPSVVIRRHRLMDITLDHLVARQMLSPVAASFLRAAVRARKSIVISGSQGAGKTTLVRALCAEIDPLEAIGTFETEYELHLHELGRHRIVHPWEARPGSGERRANGRMAGEFTLDEALVDSFRFNLARQIVGEVRGKEVWAMIKAMESGTGSISTTHASDAVAAIRKLVTCAMEAGPHITHALATSKLASTIDVIVHLDLQTINRAGQSTRRRQVAEIIALEPGERETGYATTHIFAPDGDGSAVPAVLPDAYRALASYGFDLTAFLAQQEVRS
ncbi:CpaF/VirB11 family protein [Nocardioides hungaricus]